MRQRLKKDQTVQPSDFSMVASGAYPYQAMIDAYGDMGFRFAEMSHRGSLLCLPTGMYAWDVREPVQINMKTLTPVFACADQVDVLMVGQGMDIAAFPRDVRDACREKGIIVEAIATGPAIRTYNILFGEKRAVAGAFIAVERVARS